MLLRPGTSLYAFCRGFQIMKCLHVNVLRSSRPDSGWMSWTWSKKNPTQQLWCKFVVFITKMLSFISRDIGSTKAFADRVLSSLGKNMKASRFQTWKELRQAQMPVVNVRNQFSWAHEVSAPISFQSLKYFSVLSALRFGRTGSNPNDIILKKQNNKKKVCIQRAFSGLKRLQSTGSCLALQLQSDPSDVW